MRPPTRGPHFIVGPGAVVDGEAVLGGEDARHLLRVLRARPGDPVSLSDGCGVVWQAAVADVSGADVRLALGDRWRVPSPRPRVTVVQALPKGRKLDGVVQRLSEVGVDRLVPVTTSRSESRLDHERAERALRRWRAVALAAAKQARRAHVLEVTEVAAWPGVVGAAGVVLWEEATTALAEALPAGDVGEVVLAVGPEGGLEAAEVQACGLAPATLGPTILRTETAALVAATIALDRLGRLR
jgi:16S rRNA (uracil1498-N3)-methyltransferase